MIPITVIEGKKYHIEKVSIVYIVRIFFLILKEMIFIASLSTCESSYCISTTGNHILLKD